ncbi:MAG: hypothetical protein KDE50_20495 [Caldilineaceae bacterium]|nr:hypothetical protein [Caldilineaceae bacterium]
MQLTFDPVVYWDAEEVPCRHCRNKGEDYYCYACLNRRTYLAARLRRFEWGADGREGSIQDGKA